MSVLYCFFENVLLLAGKYNLKQFLTINGLFGVVVDGPLQSKIFSTCTQIPIPVLSFKPHDLSFVNLLSAWS
jgi:hypothetical protein